MPYKIEEVNQFEEFKMKFESLSNRGKAFVVVFQEENDSVMQKAIEVDNMVYCFSLSGDLLHVKIPSDVFEKKENPYRNFQKITVKKLPFACLYQNSVGKNLTGDKARDSFGTILIACAKANGQNVEKSSNNLAMAKSKSKIKSSKSKSSGKSTTGSEVKSGTNAGKSKSKAKAAKKKGKK